MENPVFSYKSEFRRGAALLQKSLFWSGLTLCVISRLILLEFRTFKEPAEEIAWTVTQSVMADFLIITGPLLIASSIIWAYWWREKLRLDFRRNYSEF